MTAAVQPQLPLELPGQLVLPLTDYGDCPECGERMDHGDDLHTWVDE